MQPQAPHEEHYEEYDGDYADQPAAEIDEVTIRPLDRKPAFFQPLLDEMERLAPRDEAPEDLEPYVPEQAERPPYRPRMPRIDEFPMPVQNQMRARGGETDDEVEKRQMTLLEKLASSLSGKTRRAEAGDDLATPQTAARRRAEVAQEPTPPAARKAAIFWTRAAVPPGRRRRMTNSKFPPSCAVRHKAK